jgi:predicted TIM-barrel fold metal-dependent hydrolase
MIIDCHAHVSAPQQLWAYRALLLAHQGWHAKGKVEVTDDEIRHALEIPEISAKGHFDLLREHGTHVQFVSPRPFHLMHNEKPEKLIHWFTEECHDIIARQCALYPDKFLGVCFLPQCSGSPIENALPELERCIERLGFVGCLFNPDPYENSGGEAPPLGDRYWYPLWEKLCELDVPGIVHATTSRSQRADYSVHLINEENIAIMGLLNSTVFQDFPSLKIVVPHGGGAVPYQLGRFDAASLRTKGNVRFRDKLRWLHYDTVLYTREAIEFLIKTVGVDRCIFGTELPGVGSVVDPETGKQMDDLKPYIDAFDWLSPGEKRDIFEGNARKVFRIPDGRLPPMAA